MPSQGTMIDCCAHQLSPTGLCTSLTMYRHRLPAASRRIALLYRCSNHARCWQTNGAARATPLPPWGMLGNRAPFASLGIHASLRRALHISNAIAEPAIASDAVSSTTANPNAAPMSGSVKLTFQDAIAKLQEYWASVGCAVWLPHNTEVGIMSPAIHNVCHQPP